MAAVMDSQGRMEIDYYEGHGEEKGERPVVVAASLSFRGMRSEGGLGGSGRFAIAAEAMAAVEV